MRKFYLSIFIAITSLFNGQTATSIANGNWLNPSTWDCTCVPVDGYSVVVSHSVTFNTSLLFSSGGITVNNGAYLIQDAANDKDLLISGGYFHNYGTTRFRFYSFTAGSSSNSGSFTLTAMTNSVSFVNSGSLVLDSIYIAGNFTNTANALLKADSLTNAAFLLNNGRIDAVASLNTGTLVNNNYHGGYAFMNSNNYTNNDSLNMTYSMWNRSIFLNAVGGQVHLTKNFHNYNGSGTSVFDNNGKVVILDSWYNTDTVKGASTGYFEVSDSTVNSGNMKGSFTMCDLTPPGSAPFIDYNFGTVGSGITWCNPAGVGELTKDQGITIYPNPSNGQITIRSASPVQLTLSSCEGKLIDTIDLNDSGNCSYQNAELPSGVYFITGNDIRMKIVIMK